MAIEDESYWDDEYVPKPLAEFAAKCRVAMDATVYLKGDTNHRKGRHRSWNWDKYSDYSTNRTYSTTKAKDLTGPRDAIRAFDIMISGPKLWDACRGLDEYVRDGKLPQIAEWFGYFDGKTVVGWFEGKPGTSDTSHLMHLHGGIWTTNVDDPEWYATLIEALTKYGEGMPLSNEDVQKIWTWDLLNGPGVDQAYQVVNRTDATTKATQAVVNEVLSTVDSIEQAVEELSIPQPAPVDPEVIKAAVREVLYEPEWLAAVANAVNSDFATRLEN